MAAAVVSNTIQLSTARTITVAGTVTDDAANPLSRKVLVYRNRVETVVHASAQSVGGSFSLSVNGNHHDVFRVVCLGLEGAENSMIYDHVREAA